MSSATDPNEASGSAPPESGYYGMNMTAEEGEVDRKTWSGQVNDDGEPDELRQREASDDAVFESASKLPGTSDPSTAEEDKSVVQKGIDKLGELQTEAGKEYLAS